MTETDMMEKEETTGHIIRQLVDLRLSVFVSEMLFNDSPSQTLSAYYAHTHKYIHLKPHIERKLSITSCICAASVAQYRRNEDPSLLH